MLVGERRNADIERYNEIAKSVCADMRIAVNDLWSVSDCISEKAHSDMGFSSLERRRISHNPQLKCTMSNAISPCLDKAPISEKAHSDMVHFDTDMGIHALGTQVAECLKQYCG